MSTVESNPTSPPRLSMKERQRQLREDAILDAAIDFIQAKGFSAMKLEDITESIGISRATLYQHFSSKEEIVVNIALRALMRSTEKLKELDNERPAMDRLTEFLDWVIQIHFGKEKAILADLSYIVVPAKTENARFQAVMREFNERLGELIREAQNAGDARSDVNPLLMCEMLMSVFKSDWVKEMVRSGLTSVPAIRECVLKMLAPSA